MTSLDELAGTARAGTLYGIGVGPGDARYLTLRAAGLVRAVDVVAFFAKRGQVGNARRIVAPLIKDGQAEARLEYPVTDEIPADHPDYQSQIAGFYRASAETLAVLLRDGRSVGLIAEGDPFFYGSFMHMWRRLAPDFPVEVVPGVTGMSGCWTRANLPMTWGNDTLSVLPGTLDEDRLVERLQHTDAAVVMKVGKNLMKVRRAVERAGLLSRAVYVERGTMQEERIVPLADCSEPRGAYFAVVLIPGEGEAAVTGSLVVVGTGPGKPELMTPATHAALAAATDLVGYGPYLDRVPALRAGQCRHASDNRVELDRARHALALAAAGRRVAVVSGGDPGVFAMAAAIFEAVESGDPAWRALDIRVEPGVTAMLAAAAEVGAPLGGDFCAISLSDNLKSWATIERRLKAAAEADFVIALYNPASKARPHQLGEAFRLLRTVKAGETPVLFVRAAGSADSKVVATTLAEADASVADMRTLVIVGASTTRRVGRWIYTPRGAKS